MEASRNGCNFEFKVSNLSQLGDEKRYKKKTTFYSIFNVQKTKLDQGLESKNGDWSVKTAAT